MATSSILTTKELSINNAKAFVQALNASDTLSQKNSTILYAIIGRSREWTDENTPPNPENSEQYLKYVVQREAYGAKKVAVTDVCHVANRYDWTSGTLYRMYRDTDQNLCTCNYYVLTDDYNVYVCLYNNKGATSTIKPSGFSVLPFTTSDGYIWKYMFTITLDDANKFLTTSYIPVRTLTATNNTLEQDRQFAVQNAAVNGSIQIVETVTEGSGYSYVENGSVTSAGSFTLTLSTDQTTGASPVDNYYNGSSVYVAAGTGAGQLRRVIDYDGPSRTLVVNTAFSTTCNTDSKVIVSPTCTIVGDGASALAYCKVDTSIGSVSNIAVISVGSGYTKAEAYITANSIHGSGATANVVISPIGGHGKDPVRALAADKIMINVQLDNNLGVSVTGSGYIPSNTEFRTISLMKDPTLKVNSNNVFVASESIANTSNSPDTLRLATKLRVSYNQMDGTDPINPLQVGDIITTKRMRDRAELGLLEFVTELSPSVRTTNALRNALRGANGQVVYIREDEGESDPSYYSLYINNVESYANYNAFQVNDVILKSTSETEIATVIQVQGPEANTFSGQILFTENVQPVSRDPEQIEDLKIILDF